MGENVEVSILERKEVSRVASIEGFSSSFKRGSEDEESPAP